MHKDNSFTCINIAFCICQNATTINLPMFYNIFIPQNVENYEIETGYNDDDNLLLTEHEVFANI